jgi:raffinose/stachyose/melibiose transport system permease protein
MAKIQKTANTADKKPVYRVKGKPTAMGILATLFFTIISIIFVSPIIIVIINSLKAKTFISLETFELPNEHSYIGLDNYKTAITQYDFIKADNAAGTCGNPAAAGLHKDLHCRISVH